MIISYLYPFDLRGKEAPFLWVYYSQMQAFNSCDVGFLMNQDYLKSFEYFNENERWEISSGHVTSELCRDKEIFYSSVLDETKLKNIRSEFDDDLSFFKEYLTNPIDPLTEILIQALRKVEKVDVVLSWSNCPSLQKACDALGVRVIYNEIGPLRQPNFQPTAFLDFSGVNGWTESKTRFDAFKQEVKPESLLSIEELKDVFCVRRFEAIEEENSIDIGLMLQVENDSNVIAYSNGFDNMSLIEEGKKDSEGRKIVARRHPGGFVDYSDKVELDDSKYSIEFIQKSKKVITVNSGAALEASLYGKEIQVYGDSPYLILNGINPLLDKEKHKEALNFLCVSYLIPFSLKFNREYILWRLQKRSESEVFERNLVLFKSLKLVETLKQEREEELFGTRFRLQEKEKEVELLKEDLGGVTSSLSWKLTKPLRALQLLFR